MATDPSTSLVYNGAFRLATVANVPDGWTVITGTPGTTILLTADEVQKITITAATSSGSYVLSWSDGTRTYSSIQLPWNATATAIQSTLATFPGLGSVSVATSTDGSNNTIHTITFTDCIGNPAQLSVTNNTNGTVSVATTTSASPGNYKGIALELDGNGAVLHDIVQPLFLAPETTYFFCCYLAKSSGTTGTLEIAVVDGTSSPSYVQDDQANSYHVSKTIATDIGVAGTDPFTVVTFAFRTATAHRVVTLYKDSAGNSAVAATAATDVSSGAATAVALTAQNSSGLTGTVDIASGAANIAVGSGKTLTAGKTCTLATAADAIGFSFNSGEQNYAPYQTVQCVSVAASGTPAVQDSGILPVVSTYNKLKLVVSTDGSCKFFIDDVLIYTSASGAVTKTATLTPCIMATSAKASTAKYLEAGYLACR